MNGSIKSGCPGIYPDSLQLSALKFQLDEEVLKHTSFENQKSIYIRIQQMEHQMKGWIWHTGRQFDKYLPE